MFQIREIPDNFALLTIQIKFLNDLTIQKVSSNGIMGEKRKLSNEMSLTPVMPYCFFDDSNLIFVGKKGLLGKKTYLTKYNLDD